MIRLYNSFLILILIFVFTGCSKTAFKEARRAGVERSQFSKEDKYIEDRMWNKTISTDKYNLYKLYLKKYPHGNYANEAKNVLKILQLKNIFKQYSYIKNGMDRNIGNFKIPKKYKDIFNNLYFTKRNITLVDIRNSFCRDNGIWGVKCVKTVSVGKVLKNDLVYKLDKKNIRTLHHIASFNMLHSNRRKYDHITFEAYGAITNFKIENKLRNNDLFTKEKPNYLAEKYYPSTINDFSENWNGGIRGFIQKYPIISLALGAATTIVATKALLDSNSSKNNNITPVNRKDDPKYNECYNQVVDRIGSCRVVMSQASCTMIGCPEDKLECNESSQGKDCPIDSGIAYYLDEFGWTKFYCDTENARNHDKEINVVINNICLQQ